MLLDREIFVLWVLGLLLPSTAFSSPTYRCLDKQNNISYSSTLCENKGLRTAATFDFSTPKSSDLQADRQAAIKTCKAIIKELKDIKSLRDQNVETGGPKSLIEIERDWKAKYYANSCASFEIP